MNKIALFLTASLLLLFGSMSCMDPQSIVTRSNSDYFPLSVGVKWTFISRDSTDTISLQVTDFQEQGNDTIYTIDFKGETWQLIVVGGVVLRRYRCVIYPSGDELVLEDAFRPFLHIPPVDGDSWNEIYSDTMEFRGITYRFFHSISGEVTMIDSSLPVPYGSLSNVYKIDISEDIRINEEDSLSTLTIYLAPDIGPVVLEQEGNAYRLLNYDGGEK